MNGGRKFVGTTAECLKHLYADRRRSQRVSIDRLLANFCVVEQDAVHRWQPTFESLRGMSLLRVRCFLHLAGYEVREFDGLAESLRSLALLVGLRILEDPYKVQTDIGFETNNGLTGLYRVILRNESTSDEVQQAIVRLVQQHSKALATVVEAKRRAVQDGLKRAINDEPTVVQQMPKPAGPVDPGTVTAFWRAATLTTTLGLSIADNPEAIAMLRGIATGPELHELRDLLNKLLA